MLRKQRLVSIVVMIVLLAGLMTPLAASRAQAIPWTGDEFWRADFPDATGASVDMSFDGHIIAVNSGMANTLSAYSYESPVPLWSANIEGVMLAHSPSVAVSGDGNRIYASNNLGYILAYDVSGSGTPKWTIYYGSSDNEATSLATTWSGNVTVAGYIGGMLYIDSAGDSFFYSLPSVGSNPRVFINYDGSRILLVGANTARLMNGNLVTLATVTMGATQVNGASLSKNSQVVSFFDNYGYLHLWDTTSGHLSERLITISSDPIDRASVMVSGNGRYVACAFEASEGMVFLFDVSTGGIVWSYRYEYGADIVGISYDGSCSLVSFFHQGVALFGKSDHTALAVYSGYDFYSSALNGVGDTMVVVDATGVELLRPQLRLEGLETKVAHWGETTQVEVEVYASDDFAYPLAFYMYSSTPGVTMSWAPLVGNHYQLLFTLPEGSDPQGVVIYLEAVAIGYWSAYSTVILLAEDDPVLVPLQELISSVSGLSSQISALGNSMSIGFGQVDGELADLMVQLERVNASLAAQIASLNSTLSEQLAALGSSLGAQLADLRSSLTAQISTLEAAMQGVLIGIDDLGLSLDVLSAQVAALDRNSTNLAAAVAQLGGALNLISANLSLAQGQLTSVQTSLDALGAELVAEIGYLGTMEQRTDANLTALAATAASLQTSLTSLGTEMATMQGSLAAMQGTVNGLSSSVSGASSNSQNASNQAMLTMIVAIIMGLAVIVVVFLRTRK